MVSHDSSQRSLSCKAKKRRFDEFLAVLVFEFLTVLDAGPWQASLNWFYLILSARCEQSGSRECNKLKVLQDVLFLLLCLSSYD